MLKFLKFLLSVFILHHTFDMSCSITNDNNESVNEFRYCLRKSAYPSLKECVGRTAISFLQRFDERDNFTLADSVIVARDDTAASRTLVNFLDTDPMNFRAILENAGAVFSQRALEFHMDAIYPGLMFKIGPSADSNSVAEFSLDPTLDERDFSYEEPSTARILTKQYILPFLLGLKFNLVALVPILFAVICLLLKKSLFIAKLVVYISSLLGVGGVASALGTFSGWGGFLGHGFGGLPGHSHVGGGLGLYPGKNTIYSQYGEDEVENNSPYKRQNRKVVFGKTRESSGDLLSGNNNKDVRSTVESALGSPNTDRFYDYEKQFLKQDRSGKLRHMNAKFSPSSAYGEEENKNVADIINVSPLAGDRFKTSDNSGWKVVNLRV